MGLENETGRFTYLNIKTGKIVYGPKDDKKEATSISGVITKVEYITEEYQGKMYEKAKIFITDKGDEFCLQMATDSGYFRGFCNSLRNGDYTGRVKIKPNFQEIDGKKKSTCFVEQNGKALKYAFTKDNPGDLPLVEKVMFKGKEEYDGSKQIVYWKNWLSSVKWHSNEPAAQPESASSEPSLHNESVHSNGDNDDLPF